MAENERGTPNGSSWWRFEEYEAIEGTHIAPAEGAELIRYDPFEDHEELWMGRSQDDEPPYVKLARVNPQKVDEIVEWCTEFGLLGILPHRTLEVDLWPEWGGVGSLGGRESGHGRAGIEEDSLPTARRITQESYRWEAGGGRNVSTTPARRPTAGHYTGADYSPLMAEGRSEPTTERHRSSGNGDSWGENEPSVPIATGGPEPGDPLTRDQVEDLEHLIISFSDRHPVVRPGARILPIQSSKVEEAGLAEGYAQFFPRRKHVPAWADDHHETWSESQVEDNVFWGEQAEEALLELEQASYPLPDEDAFLREYGEPIPLVQRYVRQVQAVYKMWQEASEAESYDELKRVLGSRRPEIQGSPFPEFRTSLRGVSPYADPEESGNSFAWPVSWQIPSLYAGLNLMMYQDFAQRGVHAKQCRECNRPFATRRSAKKYCAKRCKNRHNVREYRKRHSPG